MNDNIWFTYKARIHAQKRLSRNDLHTQFLLVWYALSSTVLGVVVLRYPTILGANTDLLAAILSVVLLVLSLIVANRDFRGRSLEMRNNYLAMQALYRKANDLSLAIPQAQIDTEYEQLLSAVENHEEIDDKCFRVFLTGQLSRPLSARERADVIVYFVRRATVLTLAYLLPVLFTLFALTSKTGS